MTRLRQSAAYYAATMPFDWEAHNRALDEGMARLAETNRQIAEGHARAMETLGEAIEHIERIVS